MASSTTIGLNYAALRRRCLEAVRQWPGCESIGGIQILRENKSGFAIRVTLYGTTNPKIADRAMRAVVRKHRRFFASSTYWINETDIGASTTRHFSSTNIKEITRMTATIVIFKCPGCERAYQSLQLTCDTMMEGRFECSPCGAVVYSWVADYEYREWKVLETANLKRPPIARWKLTRQKTSLKWRSARKPKS